MYLVLIPYIDDVLIIIMRMNGGMMGGMTHWLDVSIGNGNSHIYSCFKNRMGHYMATTLHHLFPYARGHMFELCLWEKPLIWEDFWQDMCFLDHIHPTPNILYYFQDF